MENRQSTIDNFLQSSRRNSFRLRQNLVRLIGVQQSQNVVELLFRLPWPAQQPLKIPQGKASQDKVMVEKERPLQRIRRLAHGALLLENGRAQVVKARIKLFRRNR